MTGKVLIMRAIVAAVLILGDLTVRVMEKMVFTGAVTTVMVITVRADIGAKTQRKVTALSMLTRAVLLMVAR